MHHRKAAVAHFPDSCALCVYACGAQVRLLLAPKLLKGMGSSEASLACTISSLEQLRLIGTADRACLCRFETTNGERCTTLVNRSVTEYCPTHLRTAIRAPATTRLDLTGAAPVGAGAARAVPIPQRAPLPGSAAARPGVGSGAARGGMPGGMPGGTPGGMPGGRLNGTLGAMYPKEPAARPQLPGGGRALDRENTPAQLGAGSAAALGSARQQAVEKQAPLSAPAASSHQTAGTALDRQANFIRQNPSGQGPRQNPHQVGAALRLLPCVCRGCDQDPDGPHVGSCPPQLPPASCPPRIHTTLLLSSGASRRVHEE